MATRLPGTDVVIVGLGAAGGVAALPLAEAGVSVVGLEAGSRLTRKDFAPDELRNNLRAWPFVVQKTQREIPTARPRLTPRKLTDYEPSWPPTSSAWSTIRPIRGHTSNNTWHGWFTHSRSRRRDPKTAPCSRWVLTCRSHQL